MRGADTVLLLRARRTGLALGSVGANAAHGVAAGALAVAAGALAVAACAFGFVVFGGGTEV